MIADTIGSRYQTYLYCNISEHMGMTFSPSVNQIHLIYNWGDHVLELLGNTGYSVLKQFESICTAVTID